MLNLLHFAFQTDQMHYVMTIYTLLLFYKGDLPVWLDNRMCACNELAKKFRGKKVICVLTVTRQSLSSWAKATQVTSLNF